MKKLMLAFWALAGTVSAYAGTGTGCVGTGCDVPEPGMLALFAIAGVAAAVVSRRRK